MITEDDAQFELEEQITNVVSDQDFLIDEEDEPYSHTWDEETYAHKILTDYKHSFAGKYEHKRIKCKAFRERVQKGLAKHLEQSILAFKKCMQIRAQQDIQAFEMMMRKYDAGHKVTRLTVVSKYVAMEWEK